MINATIDDVKSPKVFKDMRVKSLKNYSGRGWKIRIGDPVVLCWYPHETFSLHYNVPRPEEGSPSSHELEDDAKLGIHFELIGEENV